MTTVHIQMDNRRKWGYKYQNMTKIEREMWELLISNSITITVGYLASALSKLADQESCAGWTVQNGC